MHDVEERAPTPLFHDEGRDALSEEVERPPPYQAAPPQPPEGMIPNNDLDDLVDDDLNDLVDNELNELDNDLDTNDELPVHPVPRPLSRRAARLRFDSPSDEEGEEGGGDGEHSRDALMAAASPSSPPVPAGRPDWSANLRGGQLSRWLCGVAEEDWSQVAQHYAALHSPDRAGEELTAIAALFECWLRKLTEHALHRHPLALAFGPLEEDLVRAHGPRAWPS